jgi:hypothetical protein
MQFPIIGVDFLRHYGLLVDPVGNQPVDRLMLQAFHGSPPDLGGPLLVALSLAHPPSSGVLFSPASSATCGKQASR